MPNDWRFKTETRAVSCADVEKDTDEITQKLNELQLQLASFHADFTTRYVITEAPWRSGNVVGHINQITLRRARLVLGWVTVFGGQTTSVFHQATQANSASYLSRTGNVYQPKCGDALRLGSKGRYGSFHLWINVWVAGKTV